MPQPRRSDERLRDVSRRMILDRTARLLVRRGYAATSLRDVAEACDMKAGSLYYHFDGKDALVEQVLSRGVAEVHEAVRAALDAAPGAPPLTRLRLAIAAHLRALLTRGDYASAHIQCYAHVPGDMRRRLKRGRQAYEAVWTDLLAQAAEAGQIAGNVDPDVLRYALLGMMNWTLQWRQSGGPAPEDLADQFCRIVLHGAARG